MTAFPLAILAVPAALLGDDHLFWKTCRYVPAAAGTLIEVGPIGFSAIALVTIAAIIGVGYGRRPTVRHSDDALRHDIANRS